jgi:hypothetical protein
MHVVQMHVVQMHVIQMHDIGYTPSLRTPGHRRGDRVRRHDFITLVGGTVAWPVVARAQQARMPVIGFLLRQSPDPTTADRVHEFCQGLKDAGYVEGENVTIEFRWAKGQPVINLKTAKMLGDGPADVGRARRRGDRITVLCR